MLCHAGKLLLTLDGQAGLAAQQKHAAAHHEIHPHIEHRLGAGRAADQAAGADLRPARLAPARRTTRTPAPQRPVRAAI